jgi:citrate lyase subunit beta-like protein
MVDTNALTLNQCILIVFAVPSTSQKMLTKSLSLTPDTICYDLEDSVAAHLKSDARNALGKFLSTSPTYNSAASGRKPEIAVRINAPSTPHALADLTTLLTTAGENISAVVVPKTDSAADLNFVTQAIEQLLPERQASANPLKILALVESARSITNLKEITSATPHLDGLIFAAEDFALSLSLTRTPSLTEFLFARQSMVTHAVAAGLPSIIDLVHVAYSRKPPGTPEYDSDPVTQSLVNECQMGKNMGFNGKQCIHPSQVATVHSVFSPGAEELEWAVKIDIGDKKASEAGRGAWTMDGKMIDVPVVGRAKGIVKRAELCGLDVEGLREKWAGLEPQ